MSTLRPIREKALNHLSAVITAEWGERCSRVESGCSSCIAWAAFDMVERITEGSTLDDAGEFDRVNERFKLSTQDRQ